MENKIQDYLLAIEKYEELNLNVTKKYNELKNLNKNMKNELENLNNVCNK